MSKAPIPSNEHDVLTHKPFVISIAVLVLFAILLLLARSATGGDHGEPSPKATEHAQAE